MFQIGIASVVLTPTGEAEYLAFPSHDVESDTLLSIGNIPRSREFRQDPSHHVANAFDEIDAL